jgi:hypothetical protein
MLEISQYSLTPNLGAKSALRREDGFKYWSLVKKCIAVVIGDDPADALFPLREHNKEE